MTRLVLEIFQHHMEFRPASHADIPLRRDYSVVKGRVLHTKDIQWHSIGRLESTPGVAF